MPDQEKVQTAGFQSWMKEQPEAFQNLALGKPTADQFRSGKVTFSRYVDKTGKTYSLRDLEEAEAQVFSM